MKWVQFAKTFSSNTQLTIQGECNICQYINCQILPWVKSSKFCIIQYILKRFLAKLKSLNLLIKFVSALTLKVLPIVPIFRHGIFFLDFCQRPKNCLVLKKSHFVRGKWVSSAVSNTGWDHTSTNWEDFVCNNIWSHTHLLHTYPNLTF